MHADAVQSRQRDKILFKNEFEYPMVTYDLHNYFPQRTVNSLALCVTKAEIANVR